MTPILKSLRNECDKSCKKKFKLINFDTNIETSGFYLNETILGFIPKKSPQIAYIET
jgi:hypothetical protein